MSAPAFCRLDFCAFPADQVQFGPFTFKLFCERHMEQFNASPEGGRARDFGAAGVLPPVVAAFCDFRTRVELEHIRDRDPQVAAAREGSK